MLDKANYTVRLDSDVLREERQRIKNCFETFKEHVRRDKHPAHKARKIELKLATHRISALLADAKLQWSEFDHIVRAASYLTAAFEVIDVLHDTWHLYITTRESKPNLDSLHPEARDLVSIVQQAVDFAGAFANSLAMPYGPTWRAGNVAEIKEARQHTAYAIHVATVAIDVITEQTDRTSPFPTPSEASYLTEWYWRRQNLWTNMSKIDAEAAVFDESQATRRPLRRSPGRS
jgi:hypothetical protein